MKTIINYLIQLDFSKKEIKIYILLLASGPMSIAELAEKAKINRTAIYTHTKSLFSKGIITQIKGESNKIAANPPEHLQYLVEQKITHALSLKDKLPTILSTLSSSIPQQQNINQSEIEYFKGKNGIKIIYNKILQSDEIRAYVGMNDLAKIFPENFELFEKAFTENPKMKMYDLCEESDVIRNFIINSPRNNRHKYKFLPNDIKLTANDILIYDEKVAIINLLDKSNMHGVVMSNKEYYNSSKQIFDLLWRLLPEIKTF